MQTIREVGGENIADRYWQLIDASGLISNSCILGISKRNVRIQANILTFRNGKRSQADTWKYWIRPTSRS